jgi:hypothetical protein
MKNINDLEVVYTIPNDKLVRLSQVKELIQTLTKFNPQPLSNTQIPYTDCVGNDLHKLYVTESDRCIYCNCK